MIIAVTGMKGGVVKYTRFMRYTHGNIVTVKKRIKGGAAGKSTIAAHLAGWHAKEGKSVMLIDTDKQQSAIIWAEIRAEKNLPTPDISVQRGASVKRMALTLAYRYDHIIIDAGGSNEAAMKGALEAADIAVIPFNPNDMGVQTIESVESMIKDARILNENLAALAVINRAPTHPRSTDTQRALTAINLSSQITPTDLIIKDRSRISRCVLQGLLIDEWKPQDDKAISELRAVFDKTRGDK